MSSTQSEKAVRFQALHHRPGAFIIPNPWDRGTARIAAAMGFEALATTSAGAAFALGRRDGSLTRQEALDHSRDIVEACDLPVSADLENCFADDPAGVADCIGLAAQTGLVGCSVEDASGDRAAPIYDKALAIERVAAAVEAARAQPFPFTLTARAENFLHGRHDLDDTIARLQAFEAAGADVLYAPGLPDLEAIAAVTAALSRPVNVVVGEGGAALQLGELTEAGVKRVSLGSTLYRVAAGALIEGLREMHEAGTFAFASRGASFRDISALLKP